MADNYDVMYEKYTREFRGWDWDAIKADALKEPHQYSYDEYIGSVYLGSVMDLTPSGKYYTPYANSNVTEEEAEEDAAWLEALDDVAGEHGMFVESGEGDPTDMFVCIDADEYYKDQARNPETRHPALPEDWPGPKEAGKMEKEAYNQDEQELMNGVAFAVGEFVAKSILEDYDEEEREDILDPGNVDGGVSNFCYQAIQDWVVDDMDKVIEIAAQHVDDYIAQTQGKEAGKMDDKRIQAAVERGVKKALMSSQSSF